MRLSGQEILVLREFLVGLLQRGGASANIIGMCSAASVCEAFDTVRLPIRQFLYRILNAVLLVQISGADVRQVGRLVEDSPNFGCVPSSQFRGGVGGKTDVGKARGHCGPYCGIPDVQACFWPCCASVVDVLPDFL